MNFPLGYRFVPNDGELVFFYLANKVFDRPLPLNLIHEVNVYDFDPNQLPICDRRYANRKEEYYLTTIEPPICSEATPTIRATPHGYWQQIRDEELVMHGRLAVGFKKSFIFFWGMPPHGDASQWELSEYRLCPFGFPHEVFNARVLEKVETILVCSLRKRAPGARPIKYMRKSRWHIGEY